MTVLTLKEITKTYYVGDTEVPALKGIDISFRKSEFVAILGPSGCGKTTMLNIIGGLDRYTSGDLNIRGVSTKEYKDGDWDAYRNNSVGFVFQNYNLIPHQSVLSNVELALTLSGVSRAERRERARKMLEKVGLHDQLGKKPTQMSGGQMQRVAIARALVNDPDIILADEPTGALDTETGIQLMEVLKEIAKDKLVIMVTHNPDLAEKYATRTVKLLDGLITDDSDPYDGADEEAVERATDKKAKKLEKKNRKRHSMSFGTALSLSLNNLFTKKARTILTSFAGSIGIIGIALIMSMSNGATNYINRVQKDTLSSYPITIENETVDITSLMETMTGKIKDSVPHEDGKIYSADVMTGMLKSLMSKVNSNDLKSFKKYLESPDCAIKDLTSDIKYSYDIDLNIYRTDTDYGTVKVNPSTTFDFMGMSQMTENNPFASMGYSNANVWRELIGNSDLLNEQYDVVAGHMPENYDETVLIVSENNEISDYTLFNLGLRDPKELENMLKDIKEGKELEEVEHSEYTYDEILDLKFKLLLNSDYYDEIGGVWMDRSEDVVYVEEKLKDATELKIVGILRPSENAVVEKSGGRIGYTHALTEYLINEVNKSEVVRAQRDSTEVNILTGQPFVVDTENFDMSMLSDAEKQYLATLTPEEQQAAIASIAASRKSGDTYETVLAKLGGMDLDNPSRINLYPKDFESKDFIEDEIEKYNDAHEEEYQIKYTDYIGLLLTSVTTIINAISYILMAFVSVSLVVSSIMIGIITYISVLERTKEIGVLRSMGASKKDISRVFNAETLIIGFVSGALGIVITLLLLIPANLILKSLTDIANLASLPYKGAIILVLISMVLTLIAGLIPSRIAAKRDPVEALRTE